MIAENYQDASECAGECMSSVNEFINRGTEQISQMLQDRPTRSLMVTCLAGFGVGLVISRLLAHGSSERSSSGFDRQTAERFGRNLLERVEHALPSILRERMK